MMKKEQAQLSAWQAAIRKGEEQLDRGEGIPYTRETLEDITQSALDAIRNNLPIPQSDALPLMAVKPKEQIKLGSLFTEIGRRAKLTDEEFAIIEQVRDKTPAKPINFE